jgi:hypothetical protein
VVGAVAASVRRARGFLALPARARALRKAAREAVMVADWSVVARRHLEDVWIPALGTGA